MTNNEKERTSYTKRLHDDNIEHIHAIAKNEFKMERCPLCGAKLE